MRAIVIWEKIEQFIAKHRSTTRLKDDNRSSGSNLRRENFDRFQQQLLRPVKHAKIVKRPSAADMRLRQCHPISRGFEDLDRRNRGFRVEVVVERVRPKHYGPGLGTRVVPRPIFSKPRSKTLSRKSRDLPVRRDADNRLHNLAQPRSLREQICQRGERSCNPRPAVNLPERIMTQRPPLSFMEVREKLSFVARYIHPDRAIA